jgi:hypothetical protein
MTTPLHYSVNASFKQGKLAIRRGIPFPRVAFFMALALICTSAKAQSIRKFQEERVDKAGNVQVFEGLVNAQNEVLVPAMYSYIWSPRNDSITLARKPESLLNGQQISLRYQLISTGGYLIFEFPFHWVPEPPSEGTVRVFDVRKNTFGYLTVFGEDLTRFSFPSARDFSQGLAAVLDGKSQLWGFINKKGQMAIKPQFEEAFSFSEGLAVVKKNGRFHFCNPGGALTPIDGTYEQVFDLREGLAIVSSEKGYGFINREGKIVLQPQFDFLDNFENGIAVFVQKNEAGVINTLGETVIDARYDEIFRFDQRHYLVQLNGLKGLITINGQTVIPAQYSEIGLFSEGLAPVQRSGKWGFADSKGNEVIPCQYAETEPGFQEGKCRVRLDNRWQFVKGKDTLELPPYDEVLPYYGYTAAFRKQNLWGFLNSEGEESIEPKYDELVFSKGGLAFGRVPRTDGSARFALINAYGKEIVAPKYLDVVRFAEGFAAVKSEEGWGFIDMNGIEVIRPQYDAVRNFSSGRAAVYKNGEWAFVSNHGTEVIPMFSAMPDLSEEEPAPQSANDSIQCIRKSFPLYLMEVVGDFNGSVAAVEDLTTGSNDSNGALYINKSGKLIDVVAEPVQRNADPFIPEQEMNPALQILVDPGDWIVIDPAGNRISGN